jgi:mercuric ion transport protein
MRSDRVLQIGIVGVVVAAICCFTPALVVLLASLGLAAWVGWLDLVLLPALAFFLATIGYGLWLRHQSTRS